jgi:hypothetical protein
MSASSRTGYTVTAQGQADDGTQTTWLVVRDSDGTGLGAYSTEDSVDIAIAQDRAAIADRTSTDVQVDVGTHGPPVTLDRAGEPVREPDGTRA